MQALQDYIMSKEIDYRVAIQRNYKELGAKKRRIADYVLENPMQVVSSSVQALAASCECEQTTIVRFAQQLGFSGYTDMKIAIATRTSSAKTCSHSNQHFRNWNSNARASIIKI